MPAWTRFARDVSGEPGIEKHVLKTKKPATLKPYSPVGKTRVSHKEPGRAGPPLLPGGGPAPFYIVFGLQPLNLISSKADESFFVLHQHETRGFRVHARF